MNCDVVRDLIPLYLDGCASDASTNLVLEHTASCEECRAYLEAAGAPLKRVEVELPKTIRRVDQWRSSALQSALFLVYFAVLTVGVALEARTPSGPMNGFWGFALVIPATGFLLGLLNWYFLSLYASRRSFVLGSVLCTIAATALCLAAGVIHYGVPPLGFLLRGGAFGGANLMLSALLSRAYAGMNGKE